MTCETTPTKSEIAPYGDLDGLGAAEVFLGKSVSHVEEALGGPDQERYLDGLMWMGPKAFCYYLPAVAGYLRHGESIGDYLGLARIRTAVRFQMRRHAELGCILPVRQLLEYAVEHYEKFEVDEGIWGPMREELRDLLGKMA